MFMYHMLVMLVYIVMCRVSNCETGGAASLSDLFYIIPNLQAPESSDNTTFQFSRSWIVNVRSNLKWG